MSPPPPPAGHRSAEKISVVIPVLNESRTIGDVVRFALRNRRVGEVLVIDDGSLDDTPERAQAAGARVLTSSMLGKGASMEDGLHAAAHDIVLYLDGDLRGLGANLVAHMTDPLRAGSADFVKARFARAAGRVTVLTARPLLRTYFPELAHFAQPLGGIMAARRGLLARLRFENDYGVDVGLLIDAAEAGARLFEADVGRIEHESQELEALGEMAVQVARTILDRAAAWGRLRVSYLHRTKERDLRRHATDLGRVAGLVERTERLALFDMDGTLVEGRFVVELARRTGHEAELAALLDGPELDPRTRTRRIAALFRGVPRAVFEQTARELPLSPGAVEAVVGLRKAGYVVGVVTDSYHSAATIVRRRVFADFCVAHVMQFSRERATGRVTLAPALQHRRGCKAHRLCKLNLLRHLADRRGLAPAQVLAVGDSENDICLLRAAGCAVAFRPKSPAVAEAAQHVFHDSLAQVLGVL